MQLQWVAMMHMSKFIFVVAQGGLQVQVESRENSKGKFGLGYKRTMTFGTFLERLAGGNTSLYLTTQKVCLCTVNLLGYCLGTLTWECCNWDTRQR